MLGKPHTQGMTSAANDNALIRTPFEQGQFQAAILLQKALDTYPQRPRYTQPVHHYYPQYGNHIDNHQFREGVRTYFMSSTVFEVRRFMKISFNEVPNRIHAVLMYTGPEGYPG